MVLVLFVITLLSGATLGFVYNMTKAPIEAAKSAKTTAALATVMPEFDNDPATDTATYVIDNMPIMVYKGTKDGKVSGYAVETMTKNGFSGEIRMMVGLKPDGEIVNIEVLKHNETPGLGSKMADPGNVLVMSFQGKNPADLKMSVRKDGGDIDAITASTISSRAYVDAVERAYEAFQTAAFGAELPSEEPVDYIGLVLPEKLNLSEPVTVTVDGHEARIIKSFNDEGPVGYAVEVTGEGVSGPLKLMVGFNADGVINNIAVVEQNEMPAYGTAIENTDNVLLASLKGKNASDIKWSLKCNGGDVDAISGATKTSQAYMSAVKNAYEAYKNYITQKCS